MPSRGGNSSVLAILWSFSCLVPLHPFDRSSVAQASSSPLFLGAHSAVALGRRRAMFRPMPDSIQRADLAAMLAWYRDMGIDAALADERRQLAREGRHCAGRELPAGWDEAHRSARAGNRAAGCAAADT